MANENNFTCILSSRPEHPGFFLRSVFERRDAQWRDRGVISDLFHLDGTREIGC